MGTSIAVDDYDGDGWDDIAGGGPGKVDSGDDPLGPEGHVMIWKGTPTSGFTTSAGSINAMLFEPVVQTPDDKNMYGFTLAWADTDGAGQLDLVIGAPGAVPPARHGLVYIANATSGTDPINWSQTSFGDPSQNANERFGWAVAAATRIGTALTDIIVGATHANIPGTLDTGEAFAWNY